MAPKAGFTLVSFFTVAALSAGIFGTAEAQTAAGSAALFFSPASETVIAGSTFEVPVYLNTRGKSINAIQLNIKFPADKLSIVQPSGGKSFISIWTQAPSYSNTAGTLSIAGGVPNGVTTGSGLVITITFKAIAAGNARVEILPSSKVLANDGQGTETPVSFGRGDYSITPKPPEGVRVFSETHPQEETWYNNNSPLLAWDRDGTADFSYELDDKPFTIPDNTPETTDNVAGYEDLEDGVWFLHVKPRLMGLWGGTTNFSLHIDTTPPAEFVPKVQILSDASAKHAVISFFTTDSLSGMDHYEAGILSGLESSPVFVEAQSPFPLPQMNGAFHVVIRAIDRAGNVRDVTTAVSLKFSPLDLLSNPWTWVGILGGLLFLVVLRLLFVHRLARRLRRAVTAFEGSGNLPMLPGGQIISPPPMPTRLYVQNKDSADSWSK
jgi:hypothetical protein